MKKKAPALAAGMVTFNLAAILAVSAVRKPPASAGGRFTFRLGAIQG
jgi:hypothetical protein